MFTTHFQSRKSHPTSKPRKALLAPHWEVTFRNEYITKSQRHLLLKPEGDSQSAVSYKIVNDEDGSVQFTVSGRKHSDRSCREFRDSSGLPLFKLHRKSLFTTTWSVTLPGSNDTSIAKGSPKWSLSTLGIDNFNLSFENQAAIDGKQKQDRQIKLEIERHGSLLALFDVVDGDRKIAEVRKSIEHMTSCPS